MLKAAAVEFAARGFRDASVRRICGKAGANIASVKYYFGDKARLYKAAIDHAADRTLGSQPPPMRHEFRGAWEALEAWVRWGVGFSISRYRENAPLSKIILREMRDPTPVFDALVRERAQPVHAILMGIVAELLGERLGPEGVRRVSGCVLAICAQFEHSAELFARLGFPPPQTEKETHEAIEIVLGFVMGGVRGLIEGASVDSGTGGAGGDGGGGGEGGN